MDKRTKIELITAIVLILVSCMVLIMPLFNVINVKNVFILIIAIYGITHLFKNFAIVKSEDYSGFMTSFNSIFVLIFMLFVDINESPWNLALLLFVWIILMSLTKLKESDYYQDRKNKLWKLNVFNLILFILSGILTAINLYQPNDIQIMVLGFFFLIHGILELMDPLVAYIISNK